MALVRAVRLAERILLTQWLLQVISAGMAVLVLWLAQRWRLSSLNLDDGSEPDASSTAVQGWRFSLVLAVSSLGLVATTVGLVLLSIQSCREAICGISPRTARHGSVGPQPAAIEALLWWVSVHGSGFDQCAGLVGLVPALVIPDSVIQDPVLGADLSFALGRFEGVRQLLVLLLLLQVAVLCSAVSERLLLRRSVLSAWQLKPRPRARQRLQQGPCPFRHNRLWVWLMRHPVLGCSMESSAAPAGCRFISACPWCSGVAIALIALGVMVTVVTFSGSRRAASGGHRRCVVVIVLMEAGWITPTIRWLMVNPQGTQARRAIHCRGHQGDTTGLSTRSH